MIYYTTIMNRIKITSIRCFFALVLTLALMSCGHHAGNIDPRDTVQVPEGLSGEDSIAYIENMVIQSPISADDLLGLAEVHSLEEWLFNYNNFDRAAEEPEYADRFLATRRDSCAMRLANRFMRMHHLVNENGDAMDELQWAVAVNAILDTFRAEMPEVVPDSALDEIQRVMDKFSSLTQVEMNMQCYVMAAVDYYRAIEAYRQWLIAVPANLKTLAQEEYEAWHDLNQSRFSFWRDVSYQQEWYSMKPMEIEAYYSNLADNRRAELAVERSIVLGGKPYRQLGKTVTTPQWEKWIAKKSKPEDYDLLVEMERTDLIPDESLVAEYVDQLKTSFSRWLAARQALAAALPEDRGTSYDNLTADIHSRMVGQLPLLVPLMEY